MEQSMGAPGAGVIGGPNNQDNEMIIIQQVS
jgi:hypothetical protein